LLLPFGLWLVIFILIPLGLVVYYGVTVETPVPYAEIELADGTVAYQLEDGTVTDWPPFQTQTSFSLDNFRRLADEMYLRLLWRSLYIAFVTTVICLLLGYPISMILTSKGFKHRNLLLMLIILPMWMNFLLRTYAWMSLLEKTGLINQLLMALGREKPIIFLGEGAVILGMVYNFLPFMVLPLYSVMEKIDHSQLDAAADLGANPRKAFWRITLPFSLPGVLEGITMVFVPSVTAFVISQLLGSGRVPLVGDIIHQQFTRADDWHFGAAMSLLVMVIVLAFMYAINRADPEEKGQKEVRIW